MRRSLLAFVLLLAACENGHPPPRRPPAENAAQAAPAPPPAAPAPPVANAGQPSAAGEARPNPAAAGLSPAQRRAYELGYRDCSQGRYAPGNHLEAYRIGCAAANDH
jgi:hypothetical protein